jgi:TBC1 domain family protein 5
VQAFLIFDGVDRNEWAAKLDESRDAYRALRDHFLKYIEHPDDLESTVDPLADDEQVCTSESRFVLSRFRILI